MVQPLSADELTELLTGGAKEEAVVADKVITTNSSRQGDRKIKQRLQEIYTELEALQNISIAVNKGVVTLIGEVDSSANESKALQFAGQVEGVVEVKNQLVVSRSLQKRLQTTAEKLWILTRQMLAGLPLFLLAVLVVVLAWLLGSWLSVRSVYRRITPNQFIANLLGQIVHLVLILLGVVLALILLDATALIGTILGAAGIIGLAVGFAVRDTVENYIASILLSLRNPFQVNDFVSIDGHQGNVLRLTSRATILMSPDGNHIRIPNAMVFKAVITNFTRHPERRFQFDVGIAAEHDLLAAQALAMKTVTATEGVLAEPKPLVVIEQLGDSNVPLRIYAWINQENYSYPKVRSEAIRAVKQAFDNAGIVMPEPIYQLRLMQAATDLAGGAESRNDAEVTAHAKATQDVQDVSPDRTVENKVIEEQAQMAGHENLLTRDAPKEM
ncbi:MAG: mechanosensitive ion channel protein MscS [Thiothrix nivea]|nr:MAG: mechanosensitive ion channel protein MscS [Thiothrix nivea]